MPKGERRAHGEYPRGRGPRAEIPHGLINAFVTKVMKELGQPPYTVGKVDALVREITYFDEEHGAERADIDAGVLNKTIFDAVVERIQLARGEISQE